MARPERFELPTAWFVAIYPNLSNCLIYLTKREIFCPILFAYMALNACIWGCLIPFIRQLRPSFFQVTKRLLVDSRDRRCINRFWRSTIMQPAKQEALETIGKLPDDTDMDESMYRLYVLDKIRKSQEAVEQDRTITSEELKREIDSW